MIEEIKQRKRRRKQIQMALARVEETQDQRKIEKRREVRDGDREGGNDKGKSRDRK